ncbi:MAG: DUF4091 domain-containing protein [Bryobacteraceae bacterium]|nr:DUF4091 domain-containing protein [Bryobacteraceae bacterium]
MRKYLLAFILVASGNAAGQWIGREAPPWEGRFQTWAADIHKRVYPASFGRELDKRSIEIQACANEYAVVQLGVRSPEDVRELRVRPRVLKSPSGAELGSRFRVRYAGLIPVDENAQYTPDPLWDVPSVALRPYQSQGVWLDLKVPKDAPAGPYKGSIDVLRDGATAATFEVTLDVLPAALPDPSGFHCFLNILVDPSSVARFNKLPLWGDEHWRQLEKYAVNLAAHSQKTITTFIVDDPWSGVTGFPVRTLVEWQYPGEWRPGVREKWTYDFAAFDRWVSMCLRAGVGDHIEAWSPLVQPGTDHSVVTYSDTASRQTRRVKLPAGSDDYKAVWGDFARAFETHLRAKGWLDKTYLAFDEIASDVLDRTIPFFKEAAPDLKLMISGGDEKGRHMAESREMAFHYGYYTPGSGAELPDIPARRKAGKRTLLYTAVTPIYPNTFIFSEPLESRYLGWIVWKWNFDGYIRWAWNFWPEPLWNQPFFTWPSGDMFFVYPGKDGPVDSIRWEMLREGIEDCECLWMAREGIRKLRAQGKHAEAVKRAEASLAKAVDLATQQFDRTKIPRDPIPARMDEARRLVNDVLRVLQELGG